MKILIETSDYCFLNAVDSTMMQVAMSRICMMWLGAQIKVLTSHPHLLPSYSPMVSPLIDTGRHFWLSENSVPSHFKGWRAGLRQLLHDALTSQRTTVAKLIDSQEAAQRFGAVIHETDLLLVTGTGGLTSAFHNIVRHF